MSNNFHYILSNRTIRFIEGETRPILNTGNKKLASNHELFFSEYVVPNNSHQRKQLPEVNHVLIDSFTQGIADHVAQLEPGKRDVLFYIHGYDAFPNLKLDLLDQIHHKYVEDYKTTIGKIILFSWPSHSLLRKRIDDRANDYGFELFENFALFQKLSRELAAKGARLHLLVHSFGNQLLNGLLSNPGIINLPQEQRKVFDQIFLMAPDVPRGCINLAASGNGTNGVILPNVKGEIKERLYDFTKLEDLGNQVHVFHDEHDFLLYISTKFLISQKIVEKEKKQWKKKKLDALKEMEKYMSLYYTLGAWGPGSPVPQLPKFTFHDVNQLEDDPSLVSELLTERLPLAKIESSVNQQIQRLKTDFDYLSLQPTLRFIEDLFRPGDDARKVWAARHRYFITGDIVVIKVKKILQNSLPQPEFNEDILAGRLIDSPVV